MVGVDEASSLSLSSLPSLRSRSIEASGVDSGVLFSLEDCLLLG